MRVWRALRAAGAGLLRDGVYVLPYSGDSRREFDDQSLEIVTGGGTAHVLPFDGESSQQNAAMIASFDRTADYQETLVQLGSWTRELPKVNEAEARRRLAALARDIASLTAIDFFPGESRKQIDAAQSDAERALNARFAPDEPRAAHRDIPRRERKDYRGRTWATRERLWIDRVCSAWLIRRFIDRKAKFVWLRRVQDRPQRAVGFDFDGAEFSHVDTKVTFEVLLISFGLDQDAGLVRLAALVRYLDVGGLPMPEAAGFAAIMTGARVLQRDDDSLLKLVTPVLDSLYAAFAEGTET